LTDPILFSSSIALDVDLQTQVLTVSRSGMPWLAYRISSALKGANECDGSNGTPRGKHRVRARIGEDQPIGAVFVGRRPTGERWSRDLAARYPQRDWILTRILWLCGEEPGFNRSGKVDSMRRFIYIHGTPDTEPMGVPLSHGCIRMRNDDLAQLFDWVAVGTKVTVR
jgi:L,D-transpeptidase YbiS